MRHYLTRAEFTQLQTKTPQFERYTVVITDETAQPVYIYNSNTKTWEGVVTAQTNPVCTRIKQRENR